MRIKRISSPLILLVFLAGLAALAQDAPPRLEAFAEAGASYLNNGPSPGNLTIVTSCTPSPIPCCPQCAISASPNLSAQQVIPMSTTVSTAGRLFTGGRFRFTRHDALEASYSFSPNRFTYQAGNVLSVSGYSRVDLLSFNYVRYLWIGARLQPFATVGIGTNRFRGGPGPIPISGGMPVATTPLPAGDTLSFETPRNNGWQFAWNYGGGADIVLERHLALRLEVRNYVAGQPVPITGTSHNLTPSAGLVFRFK